MNHKIFKALLCFFVFSAACALSAEPVEENFILEAGDSVGIWVMGEPELSVETIITDEGTVLMPLIGYVSIAGKTKPEAVNAIEAAYRDGYLQKPVVRMAVRVRARVYEASAEACEENDGVKLYNDEESLKLEQSQNDEPKRHDFLMLTVIDLQTKRSINHADIIFPNNKSRYTDKNGYVKLPASMAGSESKVKVTIRRKSYEPLEYLLDFTGEQAVTARLYKKHYEQPQPAVSKETALETAKSLILYKPEDILESKISLEFYDSDLKTILKALAARFDLSLQISGDTKKYSLRAEDVTVRELLRSLLLAHDCQYSINDGALNVFLPIGEERKTAKEILFRDMSLKEALRILAGMMKINLFISPDVKDANINFYVDSLNMNELLNLVLETNKLKKIYKGSNSYYIDNL